MYHFCPFCGMSLNLPKTPRFCPYCRESLEESEPEPVKKPQKRRLGCPACKSYHIKKFADGNVYCLKCGERIK